jgi:hypothetical protein
MIGIIWIFYDETNIADNYNIKKEGYIYYFLFVLVQIPFQMISDIIFYNIIENYSHINFQYFLEYLRKKYSGRTSIWVNNSDVIEESNIYNNEKSLSKFCFSSQLYFSNTIHLTGQIMLLLGVQIFISAGYNPFADTMSGLVMIFWMIVIVFIHYLCISLGLKLGMWSQHKRHTDTPSYPSKKYRMKISFKFD